MLLISTAGAFITVSVESRHFAFPIYVLFEIIIKYTQLWNP